MPKFTSQKPLYTSKEVKGEHKLAIQNTTLETFNTELLGLGNLKTKSTPTEAIAAIFDLEGFTDFCKQIDPQLSVPIFLNQFLSWLIKEIKNETIESTDNDISIIWHELPFFIKFMGDGLLIMWDTKEMTPETMRNIIVSMSNICEKYEDEFKKHASSSICNIPNKLRCGIARGTIYSVGNGEDYVGPCINMASRIQKLPGASFAFNRRGFVIEGKSTIDWFKTGIEIKKVNIRGIGESELVGILKTDLNNMNAETLKLYKTC